MRKKIFGAAKNPRLCVRRSLKNFHVQIVDDMAERTVCSFSTVSKDFRVNTSNNAGNVKSATAFGEYVAGKLAEKGIKKVSFDRGGYIFHGRIKAFAESMRKAGIIF